MPPLNAANAFATTARLGSLRRAAEALHVSPSAVSHQIRHLESWLQIKLLQRRGRGVALTETGRELADSLERGLAEIARGTEELLHRRERQPLWLCVPPLFAAELVAPQWDALEQLTSTGMLRLEVGSRHVDFDRDMVDIAVRFGRGPFPGLYAERLLEVYGVPVCSPELLEARGVPRGAAELLEWPRIGPVQSPESWRVWLEGVGVQVADGQESEQRMVRFDSMVASLRAAEAGQGVVLAPLSLVVSPIEGGRLMLPVPLAVPAAASYWLLTRKNEARRPAIRTVRRWLERAVAAHRERAEAISRRCGIELLG